MVYGGQHVSRRSGLYSQQPERRQPRFRSSCQGSGQELMAPKRRSEPSMTSTAACQRRLRDAHPCAQNAREFCMVCLQIALNSADD